jgi:hypothetical protein
MGYYMRYILTDPRSIDLGQLGQALARIDAGYRLEAEEGEGTLSHRGTTIAHLTLNLPGDDLFGEEIAELQELAEDADGAALTVVPGTLSRASGILAAQVLWGTGETEDTLARLDPMWNWLFDQREGLLQADGEGYYDRKGLVLVVE